MDKEHSCENNIFIYFSTNYYSAKIHAYHHNIWGMKNKYNLANNSKSQQIAEILIWCHNLLLNVFSVKNHKNIQNISEILNISSSYSIIIFNSRNSCHYKTHSLVEWFQFVNFHCRCTTTNYIKSDTIWAEQGVTFFSWFMQWFYLVANL